MRIRVSVVVAVLMFPVCAGAQRGQLVERESVMVRFADGAPITDVEVMGERFTVQRWRDAVMRLVRTDDLTPAEYLARPIGPWTRTHARSVRVCGVRAQVHEVSTQRTIAHGIFEGPTGTYHRDSVDPARTTTILLIPRGTMLVRLEWTVETARRARLRRWERKFLRSVRCL